MEEDIKKEERAEMPQSIPKSRFDEVYKKMKDYERKIEELEEKLKQQKESSYAPLGDYAGHEPPPPEPSFYSPYSDYPPYSDYSPYSTYRDYPPYPDYSSPPYEDDETLKTIRREIQRALGPIYTALGMMYEESDVRAVTQNPDYVKWKNKIEDIRRRCAEAGIPISREVILKEIQAVEKAVREEERQKQQQQEVPHVETASTVKTPTPEESEVDRILRMSIEELDKEIARVKSQKPASD